MAHLSFVVIVLAVAAACVEAQTGSVHCGVGCACSELSRPVCGTDGRTYINECTLRCQQCEKLDLEIKHEGVCSYRPLEHVVHHTAPLVQYAYAPKTSITYIPRTPINYITRTPINYIPRYRYVIKPAPVPVHEPIAVRRVETPVKKEEEFAPIFILNKKI